MIRTSQVRMVEVGPGALATWHKVRTAFQIDAVVDLDRLELGVPRPPIPTLDVEPTGKDYDALVDNLPARWAETFDLTGWRFLHAIRDGEVVGGAVTAVDSPQIRYLAEHPRVAILWDIRVAPHARGIGVGRALFEVAVARARADGREQLLIETQDNNVAACRFYSARGASVSQVNRGVYDALPNEAQVIWLLDL